MSKKTIEDLSKLLDSFNEATSYWLKNQSTTSSSTPNNNIRDPLDELTKIIKLIKAQTTKLGIIFKPDNLQKDPNTAYTTLQKFSETVVLLVSLVNHNLESVKISRLFHDEITSSVKLLLSSIHEISNELIEIAKEKNENDDARLIGVGKIWTNCDSLIELLDDGAGGLLTNKIKSNIGILDDGFDEFKEWAENPEELDDDPFGFSDDEDDDDKEEDDYDKPPVDKEEVSEFALIWVKKIELIRLLIASFKKSVPSNTDGS
ncbi:hypothetical protein G210_0021 [Candida maltosa Xu316]|uniref:Cyclin-D1-binding protein 1-like N-terminal domain-containing protein n=1 Tax=Candida maltosa (strain Xu316) TaxID=1245528 RepID=M3HP63_CANMX|nr:hypothetical protein G210_0021 [Candida maltosa Xu316]